MSERAPNRSNRVAHSDGSVVRLTGDGDVIDAGVVIFAAGVRPRDELARAAGLTLAERGGVLTDLSCRTSDPDIYAVGEVAAIEGRCYGLVGPATPRPRWWRTGCWAAPRSSRDADLSTKLKLLGVDVASFGDAMGTTENCLEVAINDAVKRTYAKLVLSDDAKTLLGGVLVGDASSYGVLRPMVGSGLPGDPDKLSRFVSFVNAPNAVDSTVTFAEHAGRKVPVSIGMPRIPCGQLRRNWEVTLLNDIQVWTTACAYDHLIPGRGVGVLLDDGTPGGIVPAGRRIGARGG